MRIDNILYYNDNGLIEDGQAFLYQSGPFYHW